MRKAPKDTLSSDTTLKLIISPERKVWVRVRGDGREAWVPRSEFAGAGRSAMSRLAAQEIVFIGSGAWTEFMKEVAALKSVSRRPVIERPGWTGAYFALQDGTVFSPSGKRAGVCLFEPDTGKCQQEGTHEGWLQEVAHPLTGQTLAIFVLMLSLVPPLLKLTDRNGNFGVELVGPPGKGKTFLLQLMSSVVGGALDASESRYWIRFHTTTNAIENIALAHSDLPLLMDDATSFAADAGPASKGHKTMAVVMGMAQGDGKYRFGAGKPKPFRTVYLITSNRTLANVVAGVDRQEAGAAGDRLLTLDLAQRDSRNFDHIPGEFEDGTEFSRFLKGGMSRQHGTAMRHFLQALVNHRDSNEDHLRNGIQRRIDRFLGRLQLDRDDGSAMRVAEAFGLVLAAGELAQHYGTLPDEFDCEEAALACYRLFQASTERRSYLDRLLELAADPKVLNLDGRDRKYATEEELRRTPGFFRTHKDGKREFIILPGTLQRLLPDVEQFFEDDDIDDLLRKDGTHRTRYRRLVRNSPRFRAHCFLLPPEEEAAGEEPQQTPVPPKKRRRLRVKSSIRGRKGKRGKATPLIASPRKRGRAK